MPMTTSFSQSACARRSLSPAAASSSCASAACVILASGGYPGSYEKGKVITIPDDLQDAAIVAGAKRDEDGRLLTAGGRVLGVVATADTLKGALTKAYDNVERIHFDGAYYRRDIGARALAAMEV